MWFFIFFLGSSPAFVVNVSSVRNECWFAEAVRRYRRRRRPPNRRHIRNANATR